MAKLLPDEGFPIKGFIIIITGRSFGRVNKLRSIESFTSAMEEEGIEARDESFILVLMDRRSHSVFSH